MKDRFWSKVNKTDGCWEWTDHKCDGYGHFSVGDKMLKAHRISWEMEYGKIPAGLQVLHECDNRACVRPDHLFLGTNFDNVDDRVQKGRSAIGEKVGSAKLTVQDVLEIRSRPESTRVIAKIFNVGKSQVSLIRRRENWKHI